VSFVPDRPFTLGETLKVNTSIPVNGVIGGSFTYQIDRITTGSTKAAPVSGQDATDGSSGAAPASGLTVASQQASLAQPPTPSGPAGPYRSRPDLHPPLIATTVGTGVAPGLLLATNNAGNGVQPGAIVYDNSGQPVWFNPMTNPPLDLQQITYKGQNALAYFNPLMPGPIFPENMGEEVVLDTSYRQIGTIKAGNGYMLDEHDLQISPDGTKALMTIYAPVNVDLSPYGGPKNGTAYEGVVQEVDIATGAVTFEWHSLGGSPPAFPVNDSYGALNTSPVDYFHLNSVAYDSDGNILLTGRLVSLVAKLDKSTGAVLWRLGGKRSQFTFTDGDGGPSWSHDVRRLPDGTISVFDNGNGRPSPQYSRGVAWAVDETHLTAHVATQQRHNPDLFGLFVGSNRLLPNGNDIISWGNTGRTTEYANGQPVFESQLPAGNLTYRVHRVDWHAKPASPPDVSVDASTSSVTAYTSWNGATDVVTWELWGGSNAQNLRRLGSAPRSGFETTLSAPIRSTDSVFQTRALDGSGKTLGESAPTQDPIQVKYASLGGSSSFLGSPVGAERLIAGGIEQDYAKGAIFWSRSTGAHEVHGLIWRHYQALGGPASVLSFPTTDETAASDGVGRFNDFSGPPGFGGSIYWTRPTGAHEIHGAIRAKWVSMGREKSVLNYPVTDEAGTSDGTGRFNDFSGPSGWGGSIYFTSATRAHEVHGAIRSYWRSVGAGSSRFRYPVTDEFIPFKGAHQSNFQGGFIRWTNGAIQTG
jgi:hypothetical protein